MLTGTCRAQEIFNTADWRVYSVDNVLEDCFQLISLFFLTIGRNGEAPAV